MEIVKKKEDGVLSVAVEGRLDTTTSPELEAALAEEYPAKLVFDFSKLEYISSAGLRVLLAAQKKMNAGGGEMIIRGTQEAVKDVFEVTGFLDFLHLEEE